MAETGAIWIKEGYLLGERDAHGDPLPTAVPPGIYCVDEETRDDFVERLDMQKLESKLVAMRATPPFFGIGGVPIRVATPVQIAFFEAREGAHNGRVQ